MPTATGIHIVVTYPPAAKPFQDESADPQETVGQLKARVLTAFGLTEGPTPDGGSITCTLFHQKTPLEDMNQSIGTLAGHARALQLRLSQQITQGGRGGR